MADIYINDRFRMSAVHAEGKVFRLFEECKDGRKSRLYEFGFINHVDEIQLSEKEIIVTGEYETDCFSIGFMEYPFIPEIKVFNKNHVAFKKDPNEHFHGFGFQRKTFDASNMVLTFKKDYRWNEATVPFFMSSRGYGIFSANTYDHVFDFSKDETFSISTTGGSTDLYIIPGPSFKDILSSYTALTGRPVMIPKWSFGLCYAARLFESQEGLLEIARRFRQEGIPCDMIGVEPGWEEHYYQMKWEWSKELFPEPKKMLDELHELGYAFELWDSGDAPAEGFTEEAVREKWFSRRIDSSISTGVDFFKQDDPYPRCITTEEMVTNPDISEHITDRETINLANTLYSETVFNEIRHLTGKRTMIIFHAYASSFSSHRYPVVWAGDFKLGNGAINASLSGHSMVTQDMRSEVPDGIHFGFLMPYTFMDSWAYYLEPWLFSEHIRDMIKFYSRLRSSLFPYLYSTLRTAHETGIPMLRPMVLEFQNDPVAASIHDQFMLGDCFMVCSAVKRATPVYLPCGKWVNYWTGEVIESKGEYIAADWPHYTGGALYVKNGSIIPVCPAHDSISSYRNDFVIVEVFPDGLSEFLIYEDDGISYDYEKGQYAKTEITCRQTGTITNVEIGKTIGSYTDMPADRKYLIRLHCCENPSKVVLDGETHTCMDSVDTLLYTESAGWTYDKDSKLLYIKPDENWKIVEKMEDLRSFYGCHVQGTVNRHESVLVEVHSSNCTVKDEACVNAELQDIPNSARFNAVINPPERVRLNHGDNWLPYYVYIGFEITDGSGTRVNTDTAVNLDILTSEGNHLTRSLQSFHGAGDFGRIDLAPPGVAVKARIRLSAAGIAPFEVEYCP